MVEGLDVHTLVDMLTKEGGPIVCWYDDGPICVANSLRYVGSGGTVDSVDEIR